MNIVIVDGFALNPGDLSYHFLEKHGNVTYFDRTPPKLEVYLERLQDANVLIINKSGLVLGEDLFAQLPRLKLILVTATGYNIIDTKAARKYHILVCNVPGYGTNSVAQHTFALLLELTNRVGAHADTVANGKWPTSLDWCYTVSPIMELANKTIGIIGFGNIGQQVGKIAKAFNMRVLYSGNSPKADMEHAEFVKMETLLNQADFVSLHCPANEKTVQMVNVDFLTKMKKSAYLINTSRGQLVDEQALANALNNDEIAGAALDVLSIEPPKYDNPLLFAKNCLITPHNAWISIEARHRIMEITLKNLEAFLSGNPINLVN